MFSVGANTPPGMNAMLASLGGKAESLTKNTQVMQMMQSFMGPEAQGAARRMSQVDNLVRQVTNIPDMVRSYADRSGVSREEALGLYRNIIGEIAGTSSLKAGLDYFGGNNLSYNFAGADNVALDYNLPSLGDKFQAKYQMLSYISQQMANPSPEFAQEMSMAATLPIAKEMIPNTVFLKAFITDMAVNELSKPYFLKRRYKAYQLGLNNEVADIHPAEIQTYDPMLVTPQEWQRTVKIDMKFIETMNFDVASDILSDGGRELQVLLDQNAFAGLDQVVPNDPTYSAGPPDPGSTTNGFALDSTGTVMTLEKGLNPQVEHLNFANQILRNRGYNPDLIIISPFELATLMSQQAILMAYAYGTREVQETGMVGTLVGNAVAWTPNLYQGGNPSSFVIWVCDSDELARTVLGHPITVYPYFQLREIVFKLYTRLAFLYRNVNAAIKIVCSNSEPGIV